MGLLKSKEENMKQDCDEIKNNWEDTSEFKLGITYEEAVEFRKYFKDVLTKAVNEDGIISDFTAINALFPDLTQKQKFLILYYGRWIHEANLKLQH